MPAPSEALTEVSNQETPVVVPEIAAASPAGERLPVPVIPGHADRKRFASMHAMTEDLTPLPSLPEAHVAPPRRVLHLGRLSFRSRQKPTQDQPPAHFSRGAALLEDLASQKQQELTVVDPAERSRQVIGYQAQGIELIDRDELTPRHLPETRPSSPAEVPAWAMHGNGEWRRYSATPKRGQ